VQLPTFFLRFLTDPDDLVLDPFAGSNTTGEACEREGRRWIAVETEERYLEASRFRFAGDLQALPDLYETADDGESVVEDFAVAIYVDLCARNDPDGADVRADAATCCRLMACRRPARRS
jgi:hypothetical protein